MVSEGSSATGYCFYVTEDRAEAERIGRNILCPMLGRPEKDPLQRPLIGPAEECAEKGIAYRKVGPTAPDMARGGRVAPAHGALGAGRTVGS